MTVVLIVFKQPDLSQIQSLTVCIAGAVRGVDNCSGKFASTMANITTLWIHNQSLKRRIENTWTNQKIVTSALPHVAFTSPALHHPIYFQNDDSSIFCTHASVKFIHRAPEIGPSSYQADSQQCDWEWIVEFTSSRPRRTSRTCTSAKTREVPCA